MKLKGSRFVALVFVLSTLFIVSGCALLSEIFNPNELPKAIATCTQISPTTVEFDASESYDPDGYIRSYEWDFGDSSRGKGPKVTHTYRVAGTYTATLTITDNRGAQATWRCTGIVITTEVTYSFSESRWITEWFYVAWKFENVTSLSFHLTSRYDPVKVYVMDSGNFAEFQEHDPFYYYTCGSSSDQDIWEFQGNCWWREPQRVYLVVYNDWDFDLAPDDAFITIEGSYTVPLTSR